MKTVSPYQGSFNLKMLVVLSFGHLATDVFQSALPAILPILKAKLMLSYTMAGVLLLASNVTSSVIQPLFGYWSDRRGKIFLLPVGCLCAGLGLSLLPIPTGYVPILLLVVISGLGIAAFHPEGFKTARLFTGDKMATGLAVFTVGGNLGLALGPVAPTFIISRFGFDYLPLMMVFALVFLTALTFGWNTLTRAGNAHVQSRASQSQPSKAAYWSVALIVAAVVMRSWTHFGLMAYIPFYYVDFEKGDPLYAGMLVAVFLFGGAVGTLVGSPLADRWGYKRYLIFSLIVSTLLLPLIFVTHGIGLFITLGAVGTALISTFSVTMVMAQELMPNNYGVASGLMAGFAIGTGGIGVTLLGLVADNFGVPAALQTILVLPLAGLIISCFIRFPPKKKESAPV